MAAGSTDPTCLSPLDCFQEHNHSNVCSLRVAVDSFPPWIEVDEDLQLNGLLSELLDSLSTSMRFRPTIVLSNKKFGQGLSNDSSWIGALESVSKNEADIALIPIVPTHSDFNAVDFTQPYHIDQLIVLSGLPPPVSYGNIFELEVWVGLLLSFIALLIFGILIDASHHSTSDGCFNKMLRMLGIGFRHLLNQNAKESIGQTYSATRILIMVWMLTAAVITMQCTDRRNVMKLSTRNNDYGIDGVEDLVKYPDMKIKSMRGTSILSWLLGSKDENLRTIGKRMISDDGDSLLPMKELFSHSLLDKVERREAAIIAGFSTVKMALSRRYLTRHNCSFHIGQNSFNTIMRSIVVRKDAPKFFKELLNLKLSDIVQSHLFTLSMDQLSTNYTKCLEPAPQKLRVVSEEEIRGMFYTWIGGVAIILLFVIVEVNIFKAKF